MPLIFCAIDSYRDQQVSFKDCILLPNFEFGDEVGETMIVNR